MNIITLPYGNPGWCVKTRIVGEILASRPTPPFLYNDVLFLVASSRMKRTYGRLFLDQVERLYGSAALVPPEVWTVHQFVHHLSARIDGPPVIDESSRLVLLEGLVKELVSRNSAFGANADVLAPSLSASVADMIEQLASAGIGPDRLGEAAASGGFTDKAQVRLLTDSYSRYERALAEKGLQDPAGSLAVLTARFDPDWLSPYSRIIIDGIHDADELQVRLFGKIASCGNCTLLLEAPSTDSVMRAGERHPLRLTREFLGRLGPASEASSTEADDEDQFLDESLFSDRPFSDIAANAPGPSSFGRDLSLLSAVNAREEVSLIARKIKTSLRSGTQPDAVLVSFPALDEYGPLVEEIFLDYGIPYNRALGRPLSASPVAAALISLLRACQEDFSGPALLRIFSSPFLKFGERPSLAAALNRYLRDRRISGGKYKILAALGRSAPRENETDLLTGPLQDLFAALEPFSTRNAAALADWMARLSRLIAWSGIGERVGAIKGPLNTNLQAWKKLSDTLASLGRAAKLFPEYRYTFREWLYLLRKTFMHARFQVPPEDEGGVQILGLDESIGGNWREIYLGGLVDGKFPQRLAQNIFLPEATLEALGVRTLERARMNASYHFHRLLLSARKVTLTWPESQGDRPMVPSPFLAELTPLLWAGLINKGLEKTSGIQFGLKMEQSFSVPELAKAAGFANNAAGLRELLNADLESLSGIRRAIRQQSIAPVLPVLPQDRREFSVTELDLYLRCPYDYLVTRVLELEPLAAVTEDISPMDRGSKVHAILRNFYLSWGKAITGEARDEARALLRKLADSAFSQAADTFRNRREKELFLTVMAERFLDAEEEFWKQGMRPVCLEQTIEHFQLVLSNGREVELTAKIDRIDADAYGNYLIVDYKTGKYPLPKMSMDQDIFQLPVYAVMAQTGIKGDVAALGKPIGLVYYDLAGKTGAGARDTVLFDKETRNDHPSSKPMASPRTTGEFEEILSQSMTKARKAVEGILAGDFTAQPEDEAECRYCPNMIMCGRRET